MYNKGHFDKPLFSSSHLQYLACVPFDGQFTLNYLIKATTKLTLASLGTSRPHFPYLASVLSDGHFLLNVFENCTTKPIWASLGSSSSHFRYLVTVPDDGNLSLNVLLEIWQIHFGESGPSRSHIFGRRARRWSLFLDMSSRNYNKLNFGEPGPFKVLCSIFGQHAWRWALIIKPFFNTTSIIMASRVPSRSHFWMLGSVPGDNHPILNLICKSIANNFKT